MVKEHASTGASVNWWRSSLLNLCSSSIIFDNQWQIFLIISFSSLLLGLIRWAGRQAVHYELRLYRDGIHVFDPRTKCRAWVLGCEARQSWDGLTPASVSSLSLVVAFSRRSSTKARLCTSWMLLKRVGFAVSLPPPLSQRVKAALGLYWRETASSTGACHRAFKSGQRRRHHRLLAVPRYATHMH
jgi:hypothetical protein